LHHHLSHPHTNLGYPKLVVIAVVVEEEEEEVVVVVVIEDGIH